jgi:protein-S-isoprenylcysteine O-methyltransferase Ste14
MVRPPGIGQPHREEAPFPIMSDLPLFVVTVTICAYWIGVGVMIVRVRRHTHSAVGVVPEQRLERFMWLVWLPLVAAWVSLPWLAQSRTHGPLSLPPFATQDSAYAALRFAAALVAVACLLATARCWARMGKDWRMAVTAGEKTALITDGPFSRIRHPIYAFSILLMLCTALVVPTVPMLCIAFVHVTLMNLKARNEERHMLAVHGEAYARYIGRTGRFWPRFAAAPP